MALHQSLLRKALLYNVITCNQLLMPESDEISLNQIFTLVN